jgi:hypothetical protein
MIRRLAFELRGLRLAFLLAWRIWRADAADRHARDCHEITAGADAWADYRAKLAADTSTEYDRHEARRGIV